MKHLVKYRFPVPPMDFEGLPGPSFERMWVIEQADGTNILDSHPMFRTDLKCGDVVDVTGLEPVDSVLIKESKQ